ncbi:sugar phosphate isomerase/epimerase family protein [Cetobacterium sp.]|uniref:sugar phosphate isomerase/epimerase family protein n=1 Tax=Cetobacterium sp. TaxID=2071632 RepID=UPI003F40D465
MKFAARLNSFKNQKTNFTELLESIAKQTNLTHLDLNYPEHFTNLSDSELKLKIEKLGLGVNGVALRFRDEFIFGEFTNRDRLISKEAIKISKEAIDKCEYLGGKIVTIWLGFDGFDYPFQINYVEYWNRIKEAIKEIGEYAQTKGIEISIEYKPYQPRVYSMLPDSATTLLMINEINLDNVGVTLDYCHMLMRRENPAYSLALVANRGKLSGIHLNDGYGLNDDGLITGTISIPQTLEFIYYLKKFKYDGVIYFDTFPIRENPYEETSANIQLFKKYSGIIDKIGIEKLENMVSQSEGLTMSKILLEIL